MPELSNRRRIDKLLGEIDEVYNATAGKKQLKEDAKPVSGYENIKSEIFSMLSECKTTIETLKQRNPDKKDREDLDLGREVEKTLTDMRKKIDKLEEEIKKEGPKKLKSLLQTEGVCWEIALVFNQDVEPSAESVASWLFVVQDLDFADFGMDFVDIVELQKRCGNEEVTKPFKKLYEFLNSKNDRSGIDFEEFYDGRKEIALVGRRCQGMLLLKKQIDFLDYRFKPQRFRRKQNMAAKENTSGGFSYSGTHGYSTSSGHEPQGKAAKALAARKEKMETMGATYRPQAPSQQEQEFLQRSALWEEELNEQLEEVIQSLKELNQMAVDVHDEIKQQDELLDDLEDRMEKVDKTLTIEIARLQELLDKSGGMTRWCPRLILLIIIFCMIGYFLQG